MSDATKMTEETTLEALHSKDPILSKRSDLYGMVEIFPPNAPTDEWSNLSFLVITAKGTKNRPEAIRATIKAKYVSEVFARPYFLSTYHLFGTDDKPEVEVEPEKEWAPIEKPDRDSGEDQRFHH